MLIKIANAIFILSAAIAIAFLFVVTKENAKLRVDASQYKGALAGPQTAEIGDIVPLFNAVDLEGARHQVVYDESATYLLFIFSPGCSVCTSQISVWNELAERARPKNVKALGLVIDSADAAIRHLKGVQCNFNILVMPNKAIQRAYRVVSIPEVLLISPNGIVEWAHYGQLSDTDARDLSQRIESN